MQPGYNPAHEPMWWWKVAQHLDEAQLALANAMAHNVDDPRPGQALYGRLRDGQAILLDIFRMKGLLPPGPSAGSAPMPGGPMPGPGMPMPPGPPPGVPWPGMGGPPADVAGPPLAHDEPAVPAVDHAAVAAEPAPEPESSATPSNDVPPTTITPEPSAPVAPAESSTEGVGG